jgi:Bacterial SH3 domain
MRNLRWLLDPWLFIGSLLFALVLSAILIMVLYTTRSDRSKLAVSTAILKIIAAPTYTLSPQTTQTGSGTPQPTIDQSETSSGEIKVGALVKVSGTGGDGLRMRVSPGLDNEVVFVVKDGDVLRVADGPQMVSNYTWWYLVSIDDENIRGWVVGNFLALSQNP